MRSQLITKLDAISTQLTDTIDDISDLLEEAPKGEGIRRRIKQLRRKVRKAQKFSRKVDRRLEKIEKSAAAA